MHLMEKSQRRDNKYQNERESGRRGEKYELEDSFYSPLSLSYITTRTFGRKTFYPELFTAEVAENAEIK